MALLQSQMTRYHQDTRPRVTNPTYASTNLGSSLGMYIPQINRNMLMGTRPNSLSDLKPASRENKPSSRELQGTNEANVQTEAVRGHRRATSQLSNAGTNSLRSLNKFISDREVFQKQQKNYNIISVQPREYQDTIKMFPKYHLEDQDRNYFRKMQLEKDLSSKLNVNRESMRRGELPIENRRSSQVIGDRGLNPEARPMRGKYLNHVDEVADII